MVRSRPIGVTILAVLALLGAGVALMHTLQMLHLWPVYLGTVAFFTFNLVGGLLWGVLMAFYLWLAQMLWNRNPQAWLLVILLAILNIGLAFTSILGGSSWQAMLPSMLINCIVLIYCLIPGTKASFGMA
jgi:hypothetical protein